jgi:hypothetical protein
VSGSIASCFRRRVESAPADATRWFEPWLAAPASCRGVPPCRASIASTSCPLRIRPPPGMPIVCAIRCSSGMSSEERPVPVPVLLRLRDLDVDAFAPGAPGSPGADPPAAADGAEIPTGASSGALGAPLRISVVSLTNGPSIILGRLGEPARPVDPVQRPPLGPELIRAALIAAECPRFPATPCVPPCVAMCPQTREMSRGAPGRLYRSPASPDRALPPSWPCSSAEETTGHPASKTLGTATIPDQRSLPVSARFADEHPIQSRAPDPPLSLTP